ncbi:hypothetical protein [Actinoplanes sp. HUAS TT8]|uniref:hypothetical protein n=1 Tax=Actinoplanes sp. HUAS TT8 TaxID=3447453 RepID=UPI003F521996
MQIDGAAVPEAIGERIDQAVVLRHNTGNAATGGVWKATGPGGSAVYKLARPPSSGEPGNAWKREYLAYESGLAGQAYAGTGIVAPRLLAVDERDDGQIGLWLAWADGEPATGWPVERYLAFAAQLGAGQARWAGRIPDQRWLSRGWLRHYLDSRPVPTVMDWEHPTARRWPETVRRQLEELWRRRGEVLDAAERTERTLCHLDVWPANLIGRGAETVLLDWSFVGAGGIGEDVSNLVFDTFADGLVDANMLPDLAEGLVEAYTTGLRAGGWTGTADDVRTAVAATGAAKYCWFAPTLISRVTRNRPVGSPDYGQDTGSEAMFTRLTGLMTVLGQWSETTLASCP